MNVEKIRQDFPILQPKVDVKPIIYFDSSCVSLKPTQIVEKMDQYYYDFSACHGRSVHVLSQKTTEEYEHARGLIAKMINAKPNECIFTKNTTEGLNTVANGLGLKRGDKVITTNLEHNSNLLPWLRLKSTMGLTYEMTLVDKDGQFDIEDFKKRVDKTTKLVSVTAASNVTGTIMPIKEIAKIAHDHGALVLVDGAQHVPHRKTDVKRMDADFLAFSGHKMLGPSGTGILYGKSGLLEKLQPLMIGGETVKDVNSRGIVMEDVPARFEAGLQNYAGAMGFGAAAEYLMDIGFDEIEKYEAGLTKEMLNGFAKLPNITLIGPKTADKEPVFAFSVRGMGAHDIAIILDENANIMIRSGMHCAHYYHEEYLKSEGTARASLYIYNTKEEIRYFFEKLEEVTKHF
jgi:cysteine desulfurase/selenocysteine lyase